MPEDSSAVRVAKVFDGTANDTPYVVDRAPLPIGPERSAFLEYLRQGEIVLRIMGLGIDQLDKSRGRKVPLVYQTDGEWIWGRAVAYYLEEHEVPPEPDFLEYLRARGFQYVTPTEERIEAAAEALKPV